MEENWVEAARKRADVEIDMSDTESAKALVSAILNKEILRRASLFGPDDRYGDLAMEIEQIFAQSAPGIYAEDLISTVVRRTYESNDATRDEMIETLAFLIGKEWMYLVDGKFRWTGP